MPYIFYFTVNLFSAEFFFFNTFEDGGQFLIFCVNDATVNWVTSRRIYLCLTKTKVTIHEMVMWAIAAAFQQLNIVRLIFPAAQTFYTYTEQHHQIQYRYEIENVWKFKWNDKVMLIN